MNLTDNRMNKARAIHRQLGGRVSLAALKAASPATRTRIAKAAGFPSVSPETWAMVLGLAAITEAAGPAAPASDADFARFRQLMPARSTYECRALGHSWDVAPADWRAEFGLPLSLRCARCGSERRDSVRPDDGYVLTRHYVHPTTYMEPGEPLPTCAEARRWLAQEGQPRARGGRRRNLRAVGE